MRRLEWLIAGAAAAGALLAPATAQACGYERHATPPRSHLRGHRAGLVLGDSTSIFAAPLLARRGLEADAKECRQFSEGLAIVRARRAAGRLPHLVVLALGANGPVSGGQVAQALAAVGPDRVLALVTPRNLESSASSFRSAERAHPARVLLVDWRAHSAAHGSWFAADGLHVNGAGAAAFAGLIAGRSRGTYSPPGAGVRRFARRRGRDCGTIRRFGARLEVRVLRSAAGVRCRHARYLARKPPLRGFARWQWSDWRPVRLGPWQDMYVRDDHRIIVATRPR